TGVFAAGGSGTGGAQGGGGNGIYAIRGPGNGGPDGSAGVFVGDVQVTGILSKGSGSFKIDHPLDPANKYLYHSFVESPDMKNIYDVTITAEEKCYPVVQLPV